MPLYISGGLRGIDHVRQQMMNPWSRSSPCGCSSWLSKRTAKSNHSRQALRYDEQDMITRLGFDDDDNAAMSMGTVVHGSTWRSALYRVPLQEDHTSSSSSLSRAPSPAVVVKKLQNESGGPVDAALDSRRQSELNLLASIRHGSIIGLADCIRADTFFLLVYDHGDNGSLHRWLHHDPEEIRALDWPARRAIAAAVAGALCYLHHGRKNPVVHHNINSANILFDADLKPKIAGFDLARVSLAGPDQPVPASEFTAANMFGYTAPEYATMVTTAKVDVYSFGVVLLELVTGRMANAAAVADGHLATWAGRHCDRLMENARDFSNVVDMAIPDRARYLKEMAAMFRLGVDCTVEMPQERPAMHKVHCRLRRHRGL